MSDWLDIVFESAFAFNQIFLLAGAIFCFALSGIILFNQFQRKAGDRKVRATIVAIRAGAGGKKSSMYYPVYEYMAMDGNAVQAESDWGSSSLDDKKIGSHEYVIVNPASPAKVRTAGKLFLCIGIIAGIIGFVLGYIALVQYPVTKFTGIVAILFTAWIAFKIRKTVKPKHLRETPEQFQARTNAELLQERQAMKLLHRGDIRNIRSEHSRLRQKAAPLLLLLGIGLSGGCYYVAKDIVAFESAGISVVGELVEYLPRTNSDGTTYTPVVRYMDKENISHTFSDKVSTESRPYSQGEAVPVLYMPDRPDRAMIDRGLWDWLFPAILGFFAMACMLGAFSASHKSETL